MLGWFRSKRQDEAKAEPDVRERMRRDWDRRAEEDYKLHIATGHASSDEDFRASGEHDLNEAILDGIELDPAVEALEIGCGVGRLLVPLSERVAVAHGVDISEVMIKKSKEYCAPRPNVRTSVTDGTLKSFGDASLDFVFSFIVFQHIPDRATIQTYVREVARVLKPGGLFRFQVDGRWWWPQQPDWKADTYNGLKFTPDDVRKLLAPTDLEVVDEWGAEGHYHWVTARRGSAAGHARVNVRPRTFDRAVLVDLLHRIGEPQPELAADRVTRGESSLWKALRPLEERLAKKPNSEFVAEVFRQILGREPDTKGLAFHLAVLDSGFEDRAAMIDTVVTGQGFRDLLCPAVPEVPWVRREAIRLRLHQAGRTQRTGSSFFELVDALEDHLEPLVPADAVGEGFEAILGHRPDPEALDHYGRVVVGHPLGRRLLVRDLLSTREARPVPAPPAAKTLESLARRVGETPSDIHRGADESFAGEASFARRLLDDCPPIASREFVRLAYEKVLGRPSDQGGTDFYTAKLEAGDLNRPGLLRELFWSEELRGA